MLLAFGIVEKHDPPVRSSARSRPAYAALVLYAPSLSILFIVGVSAVIPLVWDVRVASDMASLCCGIDRGAIVYGRIFLWRDKPPFYVLPSLEDGHLVIPLWPALPCCIFCCWQWLRVSRRDRRIAAGQCAACGYSLMGNTSGKCPECGAEIASREVAHG